MANELKPASTALLFFDMLRGHIKSGQAAITARYAPVIAAASVLLNAARTQGMMVAYVCANYGAENATTAHTIRDTDGRLRPLAPRHTGIQARCSRWYLGGAGDRRTGTGSRNYLIPK